MGMRTVLGRPEMDSRKPSRQAPLLREVREPPPTAPPEEPLIETPLIERNRRRRVARNWLTVSLLAIGVVVGGYIWLRLSAPAFWVSTCSPAA